MRRASWIVGLICCAQISGCTRSAAGPEADPPPPTVQDAAPGATPVSPVVDEGGAGDATGEDSVLLPTSDCLHPQVETSCSDDMCRIRAGCFIMGAPRDEPIVGIYSDVQVQVRLTRDFLIGQTEVTRAQWFALGMPEPPIDWRLTGSSEPDVPPEGYGLCMEPLCPVVWVSYEDAMAFANLRSEQEGLRPCYVLADCQGEPGLDLRCHSVTVDAPSPYDCEGYRLPTEAEWEYAARAGTTTAFYSGAMLADEEVSYECHLDPNLDKIGWYCGNSADAKQGIRWKPHPVAQKEPNAWGLYDMSGNVLEWVNDIFHPGGYGDGPLTDPVGGVLVPNDLTPARHPVWRSYQGVDGFPGARVVRGGSFDFWSYTAKASRRAMSEGPGGQHSGFRLVRTLPSTSASAAAKEGGS